MNVSFLILPYGYLILNRKEFLRRLQRSPFLVLFCRIADERRGALWIHLRSPHGFFEAEQGRSNHHHKKTCVDGAGQNSAERGPNAALGNRNTPNIYTYKIYSSMYIHMYKYTYITMMFPSKLFPRVNEKLSPKGQVTQIQGSPTPRRLTAPRGTH